MRSTAYWVHSLLASVTNAEDYLTKMQSFLNNKVSLYKGDCLSILPCLDENSFDSCVTDPPYHLTSIVKRFGKPNSAECQYGKDGAYARASKGFMGKQWDGGDVAFNPLIWELVFRVLKPGAHLLAFSGTRTYHRTACAIEDAGFEIRDQIGWCYGSGFPKSHDVSKGIDRINAVNGDAFETAPATPEAKSWQGWGTALKPAWEPIVLARKPLSESSIAANVLKWGTGAINVDGCRIGTEGGMGKVAQQLEKLQSEGGWGTRKFVADDTVRGRFPANLIHDGSEEVLAGFPAAKSAGDYPSDSRGTGKGTTYLPTKPQGILYADSGSAARFFYTAKADADDRLGSKHPTVKPIDLIRYLARLITPRGGLVLDPFSGTGTLGEAAFYEGFSAVLVEREEEYQADIIKRMGLCLAGPDERRAKSVKQEGLDGLPIFEGLA